LLRERLETVYTARGYQASKALASEQAREFETDAT
jgi:hypothetical protein